MRTLTAVEFLSLDGVMQAPGRPDEDTEGGFRHGGWQQPYFDAVQMSAAAEGMAATDAYLFGRRTYEIMAQHWPFTPDDDPFGGHLNRTRKYVASTTLRSLTWRNSTLLEGDVAKAVARLKEEPGGNITILGSGTLVRCLLDADLVDELSLMLAPVLLGGGKRLFTDASGRLRRLRLASSTATSTGSVLLNYRPV